MCWVAFMLLLATATPTAAQHWARSWAAAPAASPEPGARNAIPELKDRTFRQAVRISIGGKRLRLVLSSQETAAALTIQGAHVALAGPDGTIVAGSDHAVTFGGRPAVTMSTFTPIVGDPVDMPVAPLPKIAVSIHFADEAPRATWHSYAGATSWIAPGDQVGAVRLTSASRRTYRLVLSALDVERTRPARVVVALGDSITDGTFATDDADRRWPDLLAARLRQAGMDIGVANAGIGGNRLLQEFYGRSALARFDRDAVAVPGARHLIVLEGINDIGMGSQRGAAALATADELIDAYRQIVARGRGAGLKVHLATITPYRGADYWNASGEAVWRAVNRWILTGRAADGTIDFDRAIRDPANPSRLLAAYDSGDDLHPNDAGFAAMAAAIDLRPSR